MELVPAALEQVSPRPLAPSWDVPRLPGPLVRVRAGAGMGAFAGMRTPSAPCSAPALRLFEVSGAWRPKRPLTKGAQS